jgi:hypothetical protein
MPGSSPGMTGCVLWGELEGHITSIFKNRQQRHCEPAGRANARPMTGDASHRLGMTVSAPIPNMTSRSRGAMRQRFAFIFRPLGGRGECRVPAAPAVSCALGSGRTHTSNNEYTGIARHSRTQWFYGLFRALPGDRALLPPSSADRFCLSPVGPTQLRELDASVGASGPHDFAVRSNISRPLAW